METMKNVSRTAWESFIRCKKCLYLERKLKIKRIGMPGYPINSRVDALLKNEFDIYRKKQEPHPIFRKYNLNFVPYKIEKTGNDEEDTKNITIKINQIIEKMILQNPKQWIWSHNRWK